MGAGLPTPGAPPAVVPGRRSVQQLRGIPLLEVLLRLTHLLPCVLEIALLRLFNRLLRTFVDSRRHSAEASPLQ